MADFYSGYNDAGARGERTTLAQLQALTGAQALIGHQQEQEAKAESIRRQQAARATLAALPAGATSEQVLGALRPHLNPEQLAPLLQSDVTHKAQLENTRALKMLDIGQRRAKLDQDYTLALSKAADAQQKAAVDQWYKANTLALRQEAVAQGADQNAYNIGMTRPPVNLSPMPNAAPPVAAGPVMEGSAPNQASAVAAINAGGGKPMTFEIPPVAPVAATAAAQPAGPDVWSQPQAAPAVASPAAPDAANLDANDLRARAKAAFDASKAPVSAPVVAAAPPTTPGPVTAQMPQFFGSPKEIAHQKNAWMQTQTKSAGAASLSPDAVKVAGWEKLLFGTDPKGMGNASSQQRAQVYEERARIGKGLGLTDQEMAMLPQDNKVKMKAVGNLTNWEATVSRAAEKLDLDLKVAIDYAKKMPLQQLQMVNRGLIAGMKEFNDPNANAYATALNSVRLEYSRLMAGPTSNAMLPVEAMKRGNELLSGGVDVPSLEEIGKQMQRDAQNTKTATRHQIEGLRSGMTGGKTPEPDRRSEERPASKRVVVDFNQ